MRPIPFTVVAPAAIVFFGSGVALATMFFGLRELETRADESASFQAKVLAVSFGKRLEAAPRASYGKMLAHAASLSGCTLLILDAKGKILEKASAPALGQEQVPALEGTAGLVQINQEARRFASAALDKRGTRVFAIAAHQDITQAQAAVVSSVATFAALLLAAAGFVGWALARDVHADVLFVGRRISNMAKESGPPRTKAVPVRTIDQVGQLTASFNVLLERFQAAERAYRQDLSQAKDFDKDRAAFLSALSHELRTPLNAILGFADVLLDEIDGPLSAEARENLTIVRTSGEHLRSLIDDILALSALESGEFRLSRERLDLSEVAQDVVTEARVTAEQKGISLTLLPTEGKGPPVAQADRRRMRQILGNVVSNAVKFTNRGGVMVKVIRVGDAVIIKVIDTGPGIAREQLEAIFEEFQQADSSNAQRQGTGLGLSITRRLIQMHGGSVRAESELGKGSTFTLRVPVDEATARHSAPVVPPVSNTVIREV